MNKAGRVAVVFMRRSLDATSSTHCCLPHNLKPKIGHASPISRQVIEFVQPIEMVNRKFGNRIRFSQPQIDRDPTSPVLRGQCSPVGDAAAGAAKVELDGRAANVGLRWSRDVNAFAFKVISPQHAVTPTYGAIARRCGFGHAFELPGD